MKKGLLFLLLVIVVLTMIGTCSQKKESAPVKNVSLDAGNVACDVYCPNPNMRHLSQGYWQMNVPVKGWEDGQDFAPDSGFALFDYDKGQIIMFGQEPTNLPYDDFVVNSLRLFVSHGNRITYIKQVVINGNRFVEAELHRSDETIWLWLTVKDKFAYGFNCGGYINVDAGTQPTHEMCQSVINTLQIK